MARLVAPVEKAEGVAVIQEISRGRPAPVILDRAERLPRALVVVGSRSGSALGGMVLGSVADRVFRRAPVPVVTVRENAPGRDRPQRVLCPVDFAAPPLASRGGDERSASRRRQSQALLGRAIAEAAPDADAATGVDRAVIRGTPSREIVGRARPESVGLIVMGNNGHGVVDRMLLGSTARQVIRTSPCPVVCVRGARRHRRPRGVAATEHGGSRSEAK
jgi:nucleotide-binding universal stress UspA family protein